MHTLRAVLTLLVLASAFALTATGISSNGRLFYDLPILFWMHGHANATCDAVMVAITWLGSSFFLVPFALLAAWQLRLRGWAVGYLLVANGGVALLNVALKHYFERARPDFWTPLTSESTFSFPSGHSAHSAGLVSALLILRWGHGRHRLAALAGGAYVAAVGMSRVYVGVHYPSDVLAGWCVAALWCLAMAWCMRPLLRPHETPWLGT